MERMEELWVAGPASGNSCRRRRLGWGWLMSGPAALLLLQHHLCSILHTAPLLFLQIQNHPAATDGTLDDEVRHQISPLSA